MSASGDNGSGYAVADTQGQYDITTYLGSGNYSVVASASGFIDQTVNNIKVTAGTETTNVNIDMNVSGAISGTVTDAVTGLPVSFAIVTAKNATNNEVTFTDANGKYQIVQNLQLELTMSPQNIIQVRTGTYLQPKLLLS